MPRNSGVLVRHCPYCGKKYTRTNYMIRRGVRGNKGELLSDTHLIACYRKLQRERPQGAPDASQAQA